MMHPLQYAIKQLMDRTTPMSARDMLSSMWELKGMIDDLVEEHQDAVSGIDEQAIEINACTVLIAERDAAIINLKDDLSSAREAIARLLQDKVNLKDHIKSLEHLADYGDSG